MDRIRLILARRTRSRDGQSGDGCAGFASNIEDTIYFLSSLTPGMSMEEQQANLSSKVLKSKYYLDKHSNMMYNPTTR